MLNFFKKKKKTEFLSLYDDVVAWMESGKLLTPSQNKYTKGTLYNYRKRRMVLEEFQNERGVLFIEQIDVETGEEFIHFLHSKNYCKNTVACHVAGFKAVLNILYRKKLSRYNGVGIRVTHELTTAVFNSIEELQILLDTQYEQQCYSFVRDVYIIHCFIGLRFGDLRKVLTDLNTYLRPHGNKVFIEVKTQKNGELVVIPVARVVLMLLAKYQYNFGKLFTYQHYNRCIKEMARLAGLTNKIECTRTKGGSREDNYKQKFEMMSSHTARRTFATNAVLTPNLPVDAIRKITGHRSLSSFEMYVRCSVLESAISISGSDFFQIEFTNIESWTEAIDFTNIIKLS